VTTTQGVVTRDEYGWDDLCKDLAYSTPLTLMQTHHLLWPLQDRSEHPEAPVLHPYDLYVPLVDLLTAEGDYRIIGSAIRRLAAPTPEDTGLDTEKGQQDGKN